MADDFKIRCQKAIYNGSRCCVPQCSNRQGTDKENGISRSYYRFPRGVKNANLRSIWEKSVRREGWSASNSDRICSDHFIGGKRTLVEGSSGYIPSIFPWNKLKTPRSTKRSDLAGALEPLPWCSDSWNPSVTPTKVITPKTVKLMKQREEKHEKSMKDNLTRIWKETGHDYIETCVEKPLVNDKEVILLNQKVQQLETENSLLRAKIFSLDALKDNDLEFQRYTNLPNFSVFSALCDYLSQRCNGRLHYWRGKDTAEQIGNNPGRGRTMSFQEELFMVLVKLKTGDFNQEVARKFGISESQMSKMFTTWINFLHLELKMLFEMKTSWENIESIPKCFRDYPNLVSVIDCTELQIETSTSLQARKETYSNYKSRDTVKFMVGLSPNLNVNYVSKGYGGRASDKHITLSSEQFLNGLPPNSIVMADKGFNVSKELQLKGVKLIIPDFKGRNRSQMSAYEAKNSESISSARIHVERIIQRIRTFHILDSTLRISQQDITDQIFSVCAYMTNFQMPIINLRQGLTCAADADFSNLCDKESIFDFI